MKNIIILISIIIIISGCATGYPKVEGELMRVYLTDAKGPSMRRTLIPDGCGQQIVPIGGVTTFAITKDKVIMLPDTKRFADYLISVGKLKEREGVYPSYMVSQYTEKYQQALDEGITEHICMKEEIRRTDKDIFTKGDSRYCPIVRKSHYTKNDKNFLEVFKNEIILPGHLEIPASISKKVYRNGYPAIVYTKEIIERAKLPPNRGYCFGLPLKAVNSFQWDGGVFKSYITSQERKNMLKDKDPNIYWEYPAWAGFFTPDGKVNKEKLKK